MNGTVIAVAQDAEHRFSKPPVPAIHLRAGLGVEGDTHAGVTVQHRSRVRQDPTQPNLRQVHLIHAELFDELAAQGFTVRPGDLGENIATRGLNLLNLPRGTRLHIGPQAVIEVTGLRNPCSQIEHFQPGLLKAVLDKTADGQLIRKAGIMGIILQGGEIKAGDDIRVKPPTEPHQRLEPV